MLNHSSFLPFLCFQFTDAGSYRHKLGHPDSAQWHNALKVNSDLIASGACRCRPLKGVGADVVCSRWHIYRSPQNIWSSKSQLRLSSTSNRREFTDVTYEVSSTHRKHLLWRAIICAESGHIIKNYKVNHKRTKHSQVEHVWGFYWYVSFYFSFLVSFISAFVRVKFMCIILCTRLCYWCRVSARWPRAQNEGLRARDREGVECSLRAVSSVWWRGREKKGIRWRRGKKRFFFFSFFQSTVRVLKYLHSSGKTLQTDTLSTHTPLASDPPATIFQTALGG